MPPSRRQLFLTLAQCIVRGSTPGQYLSPKGTLGQECGMDRMAISRDEDHSPNGHPYYFAEEEEQ